MTQAQILTHHDRRQDPSSLSRHARRAQIIVQQRWALKSAAHQCI